MNLNNFFDTTAIVPGMMLDIIEAPADGSFLPSGSIVSRASYPALSAAFPHPLLSIPLIEPAAKVPVSTIKWRSVAYGAGIFIMVGTTTTDAYNPSGTTTLISASYDGTTWFGLNAPVAGAYQQICYGAGLFVMSSYTGGANNIVMTSPDGFNWTQRALPSSQTWTRTDYINNIFVAHTTGTIYATSSDGVTWVQRTAPMTITDIAYGGGKYVIYNTGARYYSGDCITWTLASGPLTGVPFMKSWAYGNGIFLQYGYSNSALRSTDGMTWASATKTHGDGPGSMVLSVAFAGGFFIVPTMLGSSIVVWTSPDAQNWTKLTSYSASYTVYSVIACGGMLFIIDSNGGIFASSVGGSSSTMRLGTATAGRYVKVT